MKHIIKIFLIMVLLLLSFSIANGEDAPNKSGTSAAQFLKIGVGARSMALGGAVVAATDDAYSLYWNPAAITKIKSVTVKFNSYIWI